MRAVIFQLDQVAKQETPNPQGEKALKKWGRRILRTYWPDKVFRSEADLWIYKRFYTRLTQCYIYALLIRKKLLPKKQ